MPDNKKKYNKLHRTTPVRKQKSKIFDYLGAQIEVVTVNPEVLSDNTLFNATYIPRPNIESQLETLHKHPEGNNCKFLTGVTGCGKSCILHHMFRVGSRKPRVKDRTLYIPVSFDVYDPPDGEEHKKAIRKYFSNTIKRYVEEKILLSNKLDICSFYKFADDVFPYHLL